MYCSSVELPNQALLEPRDIFMALPNKDKSYGYPRDVQAEVWKQWYDKRNEKNLIIKMNTGSGKTVVGLTILQSCLNEGKGPAVYVVPDNNLVDQVCAEAQNLGIRTASDKFSKDGARIEKGEDDYFFKTRKAVLVVNIHKLINGKSIFGMRASGNVPIGSIIIDDVHACLDTIEQQYTVRINSDHPLYAPIIKRFGQFQELQESQVFFDITENQETRVNALIPFWIWQQCCEEIRQMLMHSDYRDDDVVCFNFPLLTNNWKTCNCVISSRGIEITPKNTPISKITSFENAARRIFMSATLADDSVFISALGLSEKDVSNIITPEKANDVGDRLILFPKHLDANLDDRCVKQALINAAKRYNVVVIVPSFDRANFWKDAESQVSLQILSSRDNNIVNGIKLLKNGAFSGLTILINKYDGVDLPDDACRYLVIDGLPAMRSEYDIVLQSINPTDKRICCKSIQKIEQGMGRGVRSTNDYCVVVLMGDKLADVIVNQDGERFFSKATREQYGISKQLWEQLMEKPGKPSIDDVFELANYTLNRNPEWISAIKGAMSCVEYERAATVDSVAVATRKAFDKECIERYDEAFSIIEREKNTNQALDNMTKGVLMQLMAEYKNFSNPSQAQEILLSARNLNNSILKPISGVQYEKLHSFRGMQGENAAKYIIDNKFTSNDYLIHVGSILNDLIFSEDTDSFEDAMKKISSVIGIHSSRPDKDGIKGSPDNLWAIDNLEYFIIECKSGVKPDIAAISKSDCAQLLSSIQWFKNLYAGNSFTYYPIMIHRVNTFDSEASPSPDMRVMTESLLNQFKHEIKTFAEEVVHLNDIENKSQEIQKMLSHHKLSGKSIVDAYTLPASH